MTLEYKQEITPTPEFVQELIHETNSPVLFENIESGTPRGPAWFTQDQDQDQKQSLFNYTDRGGHGNFYSRFLIYQWKKGPGPKLFLDNGDGGQLFLLTEINASLGEKKQLLYPIRGRASLLDRFESLEDRKIIVDWLVSNKYDGVLERENSLVLLKPEKWISFKRVDLDKTSLLASVVDQMTLYETLSRLMPVYQELIRTKKNGNLSREEDKQISDSTRDILKQIELYFPPSKWFYARLNLLNAYR